MDSAEYWSEIAGPNWVREQERLDRMLSPLGDLALERLAVAPGEAALDIGCGCGGGSIALGRAVGPGGRVLGVDVSPPMAARARERTVEEGLSDVVEIRVANVQTGDLGGGYDVAFSRFGVMFFDDPVQAFSNIRGALEETGRMAFVCWAEIDDNPWMTAVREAMARFVEVPPMPGPDEPGGFSLADPEKILRILGDAGFGNVELERLHGPMRIGPSLSDAADMFAGLRPPVPVDVAALTAAIADRFSGWAAPGDGPVDAPASAWLVAAQA